MSIMAPHPTENENSEKNKESAENRCSTPIKEDNNITTNGNIHSTTSVHTEVGAKRRKPLKTNKVTQQVQVNCWAMVYIILPACQKMTLNFD